MGGKTINLTILTGRVTKNVEYRILDSGEATASFTLAVPRMYKDKHGKRGTDFVPCVAYRAVADIARDFLRVGLRIGVSGQLRVKTWDDKDNVRHWMTDVIVNEIDLTLDGKESVTKEG